MEDPKFRFFAGDEELVKFQAAYWYDTASPAQYCIKELRRLYYRARHETLRVLSDDGEQTIGDGDALIDWVRDVFCADVPWDFSKDVALTEIEQIISFIIEVEKLKNVHRKTKPIGLDRFENSAEHSWHVALIALLLQNYANAPIRIERVLIMFLLHDLGEIDVGDVIIYESETEELKQREEQAVRRLLDLLPASIDTETWMELWREFEAGETTDAKFAKSIDRIPSLLQNLRGRHNSWQEHDISKEQVLAVNRRIDKGCSSIWTVLEPEIWASFET